ncbi:MAG: DUF2937 family protein [Methylococcaceae bacterium]|nr:DUF2937 family protein [Methylococcaceae bacterium]
MFIAQSLKNLLDKLFFAGCLLLGIQIPNFIIQYQQNISAHYQESVSQLQQYQFIADRFYAGDMHELLLAHRMNTVAAIRAEAQVIADLIQRNEYLQQELSALQDRSLVQQLLHLTKHLDFKLANEVLFNYSMSVPLNSDAIVIGLVLAFLCSIALHLVLASLFFLFRSTSRNTKKGA